jgi:hypothetical protein
MEAPQPITAIEASPGGFYRTPKGHVVRVLEARARQVCVGYQGLYGLGWRTTWLPADALLVPAPEITEFPQ